jgi:hypothetical protein
MKRLFELAFAVLIAEAVAGAPAYAAAPVCEQGMTAKTVLADNAKKGCKIIKLSPEQKQIVEDDYNRRDPPTNERFDAIYIAKRADFVDPNTGGEPMALIVFVRGGLHGRCRSGARPHSRKHPSRPPVVTFNLT